MTLALNRALTPAERERLLRLHRALGRLELECPLADDWRAEHDAFNEGRRERWTLSVVNRIQLRETAIVVRGPHPTRFLPAPSAAELVDEMEDNLTRYWRAKTRRRALWLDEAWVRFGIATLARIHFTLETGELISKPDALERLRQRRPEVTPLLDGEFRRLRRAVRARRLVRDLVDEGVQLLPEARRRARARRLS